MPSMPMIHIQNSEPGPPERMAVATPTIEPVPMVAASAVASAWKGVMSPSSSPPPMKDFLMASGSLRWMNFMRTVK